MKRKGLSISTGTISNLSFDFLLLIKQIHEKNIGGLTGKLNGYGGTIIHIDATDEKGGNAIFQIKDGRSGITLFAESMITEKEEYIIPILERFKEYFGEPLAIVRDMGAAVVSSSDKVFPGVPKQICHYHFMRAHGTKLFDDRYSKFRNAILDAKIVADLYYIRKKVKEKLKESSVMFYERHVLYWLHLLVDYLLYPIKRIVNYPFRLVYMEFYERIIEISNMITEKDIHGGGAIIKVHQLSSFIKRIREFVKNKKIRELADEIDVLWGWFIETRKTMRLMRNELREPKTIDSDGMKTMKKDLKKLLRRIQMEGKKRGGVFLRKSKMINKDFQDKWETLFIEIEDMNGNPIPVRQDNNIDERAHRWIRMGIRRRTGKSRTQMEMYQLGALLAYFSNLYNKEYRDVVFKNMNNLTDEFCNLNWKELPKERRKLFFCNDGMNIPLKDKPRKELIMDYVDNMIVNAPADQNYLDGWLLKMNDLVESWNIDFVDVDSEMGF